MMKLLMIVETTKRPSLSLSLSLCRAEFGLSSSEIVTGCQWKTFRFFVIVVKFILTVVKFIVIVERHAPYL